MTRKERVAAIVKLFYRWRFWIENRKPGWSTDEELADKAYDYLRHIGVDTPGITPDAAKHARQRAGIWWRARRRKKQPTTIDLSGPTLKSMHESYEEAPLIVVDPDPDAPPWFGINSVSLEGNPDSMHAAPHHPDMIDDDAEQEGNIAAAILDLARSVRFLADAIDGRDVK